MWKRFNRRERKTDGGIDADRLLYVNSAVKLAGGNSNVSTPHLKRHYPLEFLLPKKKKKKIPLFLGLTDLTAHLEVGPTGSVY